MKMLAVIQSNYTDLINFNLKYNCITALKESGLFDNIVLVAPDIPENNAIEDFAKTYDIDVFLGDVENVVQRIISCSKKYNAEIIARVLLNYFFIDVKLINEMINHLIETGCDYVNLPPEFDSRFGADIFRRTFLEKINKTINVEGEKKGLFNPWGYAELHKDKLYIETFRKIPVYDSVTFQKVKEKYDLVWPERHISHKSPLYPYDKAKSIMEDNKGMKVLDVACGEGNGTFYLSKYCSEIVGVDIDSETVLRIKSKFTADNLRFIVADAEKLALRKNYFDIIISIHTMEHLRNDVEFMYNCYELLKENGTMILEVPKRKEYPFKGITKPLSRYHIREYTFTELEKTVSNNFKIKKSFGVSRGFYTVSENARDAYLLILSKES